MGAGEGKKREMLGGPAEGVRRWWVWRRGVGGRGSGGGGVRRMVGPPEEMKKKNKKI